MGKGLWRSIVAIAVTTSPAAGQAVAEHRPVFSPDGERVVFMRQSEQTGGDWELFLSGVADSTARRLTTTPGWDGYAVFSPDGTSIVFDRATDDDGGKQPHLLDLGSRKTTPLGAYEGWLSVSDWSDEQGLLAFWEKDGQRDLYILERGGRIARRLTDTSDRSEHDAHFSPDGALVAFAAGPAVGEGATTLEVMGSAGEGRRTVVESDGRIYGLDWSPDGRRIAFTDAPDGENGDVFVVEVESGRIERMTEDPAWDHMPVWDPSGTRLLFTSYRSGSERMYWLEPGTGSIVPWEPR